MPLDAPGPATITSLAELVAPLGEAAFLELLRAPRPMLARGDDPNRYRALTDWAAFTGAIETGAIPASKVRLTRKCEPLAKLFFRDGDTMHPGVLAKVLDVGGSAIVYGVDACLPGFGALCAAISAQLPERVLAGVIATSGAGGALRPHYDEGDLVVVQIEGAKRWIIEGNPAVHPLPRPEAGRAKAGGAVILDTVLRAGDLLFLPAGYRHRCENQEGRSLHAGFFFFPFTELRALELIARRLARSPERRAPMRFSPESAREIEAGLKTRLIQAIETTSLADLLAEHLVAPPDSSIVIAAGVDGDG